MIKYYSVLAIILISCSSLNKNFDHTTTFHISSVNNNVCKKLIGNVVLYAIFVDSEPTSPWTEYDIETTLDSIHHACKWIENQAKKNNINLNICVEHHKNKDIIPIAQKMTKKTLSQTIGSVNGVRDLNRWSDKVAKVATTSLGSDNSVSTKTKIQPKNKEKLLARLRDKYKTDNVALVYFINNFYKKEVSVAVNIKSHANIEYSVISFKNPSVIAHEFLHLFGALDLYFNPLETERRFNRKAKQRLKYIQEVFPNEIMAFSHRNISTLQIDSLTSYLVGWHKEVNEEYIEMLTGFNYKLAKY